MQEKKEQEQEKEEEKEEIHDKEAEDNYVLKYPINSHNMKNKKKDGTADRNALEKKLDKVRTSLRRENEKLDKLILESKKILEEIEKDEDIQNWLKKKEDDTRDRYNNLETLCKTFNVTQKKSKRLSQKYSGKDKEEAE